MSDFQPVARLSELVEYQPLCVEVDDEFVVLIRIGDEVFCIDDVCTHDGGPLGEGQVENHCIICPRHGAKFDVRTGAALCLPATEPTRVHQVRIEGDQVLVKLADD
ncbi:MAG: non-heme iron oxygenase ferredoxin subunit [Planctomycetota bacterium]|nr:MAG: non-heme iron oxygenase ferredoxin subunit [Planctomycetota bacterium]